MSIFDKLKKNVDDAVKNTVSGAAKNLANHKETFTFRALPESLAELQALPEAVLDTPFQTAALTVCALCVYAADRNIGTEMMLHNRSTKTGFMHCVSGILQKRSMN